VTVVLVVLPSALLLQLNKQSLNITANGGGADGGGAPIVRMVWHPDGLSVHHKIQKMASNDGEADKGCSEFCVTVGTVTRTTSLLIYSRLKALAVNLSRPSSKLWCMLA